MTNVSDYSQDRRGILMIYDQSQFDIRCEWGEKGVVALAPISDAIIIVDVMSFSTAVTIATGRGATVYPFRGTAEASVEFAREVNAELADKRRKGKYSLSPASLMAIPPGTRLVLPSPNGSTLTLSTGDTPTFAGCLRNAKTVARAASRCGPRIAVIPSGERWWADLTLRPAFEDWVGAGAIISHLGGTLSPEAGAALAAFRSSEDVLVTRLKQCSSGKELISKGSAADIGLIGQLDVDDVAPLLKDGAYVREEV